jgi:hypothetical protein
MCRPSIPHKQTKSMTSEREREGEREREREGEREGERGETALYRGRSA